MVLRSQFQKATLVCLITWTIMIAGLPVRGQDLIASSSITGGSSVFVFRSSRKAKKNSFVARRKSKAKRARSQRNATRRRVVNQSQDVAKKNRDRRNIDQVTPEEFAKIEIKRISPEAASKVFAGLAEYQLERDKVDEAILAYEEAVQLDKNNKDAVLGLSEVYTRKGDETLEEDEFDKAQRYYDEAIRLDPKNSSAYAGRGQVFDEQEKESEAMADYLKALSIDPTLTQVKAPLGILYYQEGEIAKSEKYIAEALADGADTAETQYFLGLIRYKQGRDAEAETALRKSISIDDSNDDAHYYLGAVLNRLTREPEAIREFERATQIDAKYVPAWFDLGVAYYNQERFAESVMAFKQAISYNTNSTDELKRIYNESFANIAESYRQTNELDLAISNYRIATARITTDPELFTNYGFVLGKKDRWNPAIDSFKKAAALQPDAISYANLGWAYYQRAIYDKSYNHPKSRIDESLRLAKPALINSINYNPNFVAALLNLGVVLNDLGEHSDAVVALEKADSIQKNWVPVMNELGIAYLRVGRYRDAIQQFKKVVRAEGNNVWGLFYLSESEFRNGDINEARKIQRQIRSLDRKMADRLETLFRTGKI